MMKEMTCHQLGGACDLVFEADSFDDMAQLSKEHAMDMLAKADPDHLKAMEEMKSLMQDPEAMAAWFAQKRQDFENL